MKYKMGLALLIICGCLLGVYFYSGFFTTHTSGDHRNITDLETAYKADAEIAQAIERLKTSPEKAPVITHSTNGLRRVAITFDGLTDRSAVEKIVDLLAKYNAKATFFVDGLQTAEDPQAVIHIQKAGQRIENYTMAGLTKMESLPVERLVNDFSRAQKIIKVNTDRGPNLLKCNDTKYVDHVLKAAKACGFNGVVLSDVYFPVNKIRSQAEADRFVSAVRPGSIVSIKLAPNADPIVHQEGKTDLRPAIDKQPGLKKLDKPEQPQDTVQAVEWLLAALKKANYATVFVEDFPASSISQPQLKKSSEQIPPGSPKQTAAPSMERFASLLIDQFMDLFSNRIAYAAEIPDMRQTEIKEISTAEPALSYTFAGLTKPTVVDDVLNRLHVLGIRATFFVTETEMQKYPGTVRKIIENRHEVGIAITPKSEAAFDETSRTIFRTRKILKEQYGVSTNLVKQPWGAITDATKAAVSASACKLIGHSVNIVQNKHKDYQSAEQIFPEIFGKYMISLSRGQIVHFRMDYYTQGHLVAELVEMVKQRKVDNIAFATSYDNPRSNPDNDSQYVIKPVGDVLDNANYTYRYPVDQKDVPERLRYINKRLTVDKGNLLAEAAKRYIGSPEVDHDDRMLGFSKMETRRLDMSGLIHTEDNVIFLTFDDWGTDAAINKLLYVLRKHNVPGTFFVITNNVPARPNLLRAIAIEGHEIGSHSDKHRPMTVRDPKTGKQVGTQGKEEYVQDLAASYKKLSDITGDVTVDGRPVLTRFFRPPTLAISKMGVESLFETGYEYIISGASTSDYAAESVPQLLNTVKSHIYTPGGTVKKGTVLVLHMGDSCVYTPIALDILLTANAAKADTDPTKFKVGRLSDYLLDGYSQTDRHKTLQLHGGTKLH